MIDVTLGKEAVSELGFNIATGVIVEKLIKDGFKGTYYVNVFTLYRNFIGCLEGGADDKIKLFKSRLRYKKMIEAFVKDTNMFVTVCMENNISVTIYELDYPKINNTFRNFKSAIDFKGLKYFIISTQQQAAEELKKAVPGVYKKMGIMLPHIKNMLITTHIGLDLLPLTKFKDIKIIESHTAEIKDSLRWYSKLGKFGKNDMSVIPFNEVTYRIFGDSEFVKPEGITMRRSIYLIAKKLHWYQGLKDSDVLRGITREDKELGNRFKRLFKLIF